VAERCSHCDAELWRDDARFCPHCGSSVQAHVQSSKGPASATRPIPRIEDAEQDEMLLAEGSSIMSATENPTIIPVSEDSMTIPASDNPSIIPVSEDPSIIPVSEDPSTFPISEDPSVIPVFEGSSIIPVSEDSNTFPVSEDLSLIPVSWQHSRFSLRLVISLAALVIVGVISWLLFVEVTANTSPWQSFSDTKLGFAVSYPTDWQVQVDDNQSIVRFHDSTQTGKVNIAVFSSTAANNVAQFLQQQASQRGMTDVTTEPSRSFAGTSWQQVQGKLSQEGVSYSAAMLATMHDHRLYLLTQISPRSTYNDEEKLIFSVMRANLQFL
jgi:hypothetical protein